MLVRNFYTQPSLSHPHPNLQPRPNLLSTQNTYPLPQSVMVRVLPLLGCPFLHLILDFDQYLLKSFLLLLYCRTSSEENGELGERS